jgi:hypothetical protein
MTDWQALGLMAAVLTIILSSCFWMTSKSRHRKKGHCYDDGHGGGDDSD